MKPRLNRRYRNSRFPAEKTTVLDRILQRRRFGRQKHRFEGNFGNRKRVRFPRTQKGETVETETLLL